MRSKNIMRRDFQAIFGPCMKNVLMEKTSLFTEKNTAINVHFQICSSESNDSDVSDISEKEN